MKMNLSKLKTAQSFRLKLIEVLKLGPSLSKNFTSTSADTYLAIDNIINSLEHRQSHQLADVVISSAS